MVINQKIVISSALIFVFLLTGCKRAAPPPEPVETPTINLQDTPPENSLVENIALPFPDGFDWPADPQTLQSLIDAKNTSALRTHAWYLWAGVNTLDDAGRPIWWTWPTSTQEYPWQPAPGSVSVPTSDGAQSLTKHGLRALNAANTPINLPSPIYVPPQISGETCIGQTSANGLPDGPQFQSNGDIMIAGVIYNSDAADWLTRTSLADGTALTEAWNQGEGVKSISPFPSTSIVLKHMYWPIRGDDFTAVPMWDAGKYPNDYPNYIGYEYWKRIVIVDPRNKNPKPGMTGVTNWLHNVYDANGKALGPFVGTGQITAIENFYHQQLDAVYLKNMDPRDRAILDASSCWLFNRPFKANDYLITVATHIITKEIIQWTLQSAWWHDKPNAGPFAKDRPNIPATQAPGPWQHYLLTSEYGIEDASGLLPIAFNPYIELAGSHPIKTNCRNCHMRASWPRGSFTITPPPSVTNSYEASGGPGPLVDLNFSDAVFNQLMTTDFQWAVADRAGVPTENSATASAENSK